jgi:hypothetical protein
MESSVVDLYRQRRLASDASSSSQFTNSINSGTFSIKQHGGDTGVKTVALEQQPTTHSMMANFPTAAASNKTVSSGNQRYPAGRDRLRKYSMVSATHSAAAAIGHNNNPANIYDKFWVPPEIARLAKLDKQRSSLPNTSVMPPDSIMEINEKLDVVGPGLAVVSNSGHNRQHSRSPSPHAAHRSTTDNATGKLTYFILFHF